MNKTEILALPQGRVIHRHIQKSFGRESHYKHVVISPLFIKVCSDCTHPFPFGEKVVRFVASNRVIKTKCIDCYLVKMERPNA